MYNVCGTWPFTSRVHYLSILNTNRNVLGYWKHRLICCTCLFTTPLVVTTISVYNELWPSDVMSRSSPLISSLLSVWWSLFSVFISVSLLCLLCSLFFLCLPSHLSMSLCLISCPSNTVVASGIEDTFSHGCIFRCFGFATIWLLRKLLTVRNCWVAVE
jgi:hypothetical protein